MIPEFDLQRFNTLGVPAIAAFYCAVSDQEGLIEALNFARERQLPLLVLGGGSNLLLGARFEGLVVHINFLGIECLSEDDTGARFKVAAGVNWHDWVMHTVQLGLGGLANLALIPGNVGAAPIQNIGAYGVEVDSVISEVHTIEVRSQLPVTFTRDACQFGYRDSFFKQAGRDQFIITHVVFDLTREVQGNLNYPGLHEMLEGRAPTPAAISDAVIRLRQAKLPDPNTVPNVGSFFKNPIIETELFSALLAQYPAMPHYPAGAGKTKLAAGWLIDQAGWRGREYAGARVHPQQALVLTNPARLPSAQVLELANEIQKAVAERFGIALEMEPRVY